MKYFVLAFKSLRRLKGMMLDLFFTPYAKLNLMVNGVQFGKDLHVNGLIKVMVTRRGVMNIGNSLRLNSGENFNVIGRQQKCIFWVEGKLTIKNNAGISACAIICNHQITIGNNVIIGGNTVIYDTDFHSLVASQRINRQQDRANMQRASVVIHDNVFIGAHTTILKGVTIGENSVVGACSVVSKSIPANEIWAGNPARKIREISSESFL